MSCRSCNTAEVNGSGNPLTAKVDTGASVILCVLVFFSHCADVLLISTVIDTWCFGIAVKYSATECLILLLVHLCQSYLLPVGVHCSNTETLGCILRWWYFVIPATLG